jgi:steroid delta-isomerase-like uncharacterized protein
MEKINNKKEVEIWYESFNAKNAEMLKSVLEEKWIESPTEDGVKPADREAVLKMLVKLTSTFPDFKIVIEDIIAEGDKVVVRSTITGTQVSEFHGFPSKNKKIKIQAIDIHEFKNRKIIHTWHSEDWMTGLKQLGVFEK